MSLVVHCQVSTYINIKTEPSCSTLQETPLQTKANRSTAAMCNQQLLDPSYDQSCNQFLALSLSISLTILHSMLHLPQLEPPADSQIFYRTPGRGGEEMRRPLRQTTHQP